MTETVKQDLKQQLEIAQREMEVWEQQEATRNDGSQAQDTRFEERGKRLQTRVSDLTRQLATLTD